MKIQRTSASTFEKLPSWFLSLAFIYTGTGPPVQTGSLPQRLAFRLPLALSAGVISSRPPRGLNVDWGETTETQCLLLKTQAMHVCYFKSCSKCFYIFSSNFRTWSPLFHATTFKPHRLIRSNTQSFKTLVFVYVLFKKIVVILLKHSCIMEAEQGSQHQPNMKKEQNNN